MVSKQTGYDFYIVVVLGQRHTGQSEQRIGFCGHSNAEQGILRLFVNLGFPIIDIVLLGNRQVAHDGALGVEELDFRTGLDKTVGNLQLRLKLPGRNTLFLNR